MAESGLEANAIIWAEAQTDIVSLCEQPIRIMGSIEKKPYYTFDLGVRMSSGEEVLYEIKPSHQLIESGRWRCATEQLGLHASLVH